jgi:hypothetical protein
MWPVFYKSLEPWVGSKILKVDGSILKKVQESLPDGLPNSWQCLSVTIRHSPYSIGWTIRTFCRDGEDLGSYEDSIAVGYIHDGILTQINDHETLKTDYKVEEVEQARLHYRQAKEAVEKAERALYPFGERDI